MVINQDRHSFRESWICLFPSGNLVYRQCYHVDRRLCNHEGDLEDLKGSCRNSYADRDGVLCIWCLHDQPEEIRCNPHAMFRSPRDRNAKVQTSSRPNGPWYHSWYIGRYQFQTSNVGGTILGRSVLYQTAFTHHVLGDFDRAALTTLQAVWEN